MQSIKELDTLLAQMTPFLHPELWYYCHVEERQLTPTLLADCFAMIKESESITLVLSEQAAESFEQTKTTAWQRIELQVFSSLEAVGLTAAISQCLTETGISANVIAGYHHDHIFVPSPLAQKALLALKSLSNNQCN